MRFFVGFLMIDFRFFVRVLTVMVFAERFLTTDFFPLVFTGIVFVARFFDVGSFLRFRIFATFRGFFAFCFAEVRVRRFLVARRFEELYLLLTG